MILRVPVYEKGRTIRIFQKTIVLLLISTFLSFGWRANGSFAPRLTYVGHATILFQGRETTVLTDPFWGKKILMGLKRRIPPGLKIEDLPPVGIVLVSHTHPDHYDVNAINSLPGNPVVVLPWGRGGELRNQGLTVVKMRPWEKLKIRGVEITATPARHMAGHCLGYVIRMEGTSFYFTGDTKLYGGIDRLRSENIDVMLSSYDGFPLLGSTWTSDQAAEAVDRVRPKIFIPIHWGTFRNWWSGRTSSPPETFAEILRRRPSATKTVILQPGESRPFSAFKIPSARAENLGGIH